ncbi:hypothetical protein RIF29_03606 [Crotalaria pallida]|uniref:Zinc finger C3HC4 RING-type domain-containing protein n=1 Tax=Crotalaria pallida TaxID=3830 RepID=A0AAN9J0B3_CROPI
MVHQSSKNFCGICLDFKPAPDMFRKGKCKHPFCIDCISKHVAAQIQQNRLEWPAQAKEELLPTRCCSCSKVELKEKLHTKYFLQAKEKVKKELLTKCHSCSKVGRKVKLTCWLEIDLGSKVMVGVEGQGRWGFSFLVQDLSGDA